MNFSDVFRTQIDRAFVRKLKLDFSNLLEKKLIYRVLRTVFECTILFLKNKLIDFDYKIYLQFEIKNVK